MKLTLPPFLFFVLLLSIPWFAATVLGAPSDVDQSGFLLRRMAPQYEEAARALRDAPPQQYDFAKSNLGDVLRFLATDAKISFFSLPDDSPESNRVITFSIYGSPFQVLETLCKANALVLIPENGMWYIRPADDRELIGKGYDVKHNAMEKVEKAQELNLGGGGGQGSILSASVDLQGAQETFSVKRSELINNIRAMLDLPLEKANGDTSDAQQQQTPGQVPGLGQDKTSLANSNDMSAVHQPKVIWNSDSNTLYVVATRLQHMWVEGYLASADKEQSLIAIEVKFIESSSDPTKELGIDWSGTLGQNGTFRQITKQGYETVTTTDPATGKSVQTSVPKTEYDMLPNSDGGFRVDAAQLIKSASLANVGAAWPLSTVLSAQDLNLKLRALINDSDTKTTSYPRMVTLNNREVSIRAVVNQPILSGTASSSGSGGGATTSQQITYLPIGTVLNILPKKMEGDKVLLNMAITVSTIISETLIAGNKYPIASSRVYRAPVEVNDGYTVAVGGLDEAKEKESATGVPLLSKVPILGWAFKSKSRAKNHKNLMLFITPTLINPKDGGLPSEPISVVPHRPENMLPKKPQLDPAGSLAGGPDAVPAAVTYLSRECDKIQTTINEARQTDEDSRKLTDMKIAINQLEAQVEGFATKYPDKSAALLKATADIGVLHDRVSKMKGLILKKSYY